MQNLTDHDLIEMISNILASLVDLLITLEVAIWYLRFRGVL